ncbi:MAG: serine hydrolase [Myxococcota bacterium]
MRDRFAWLGLSVVVAAAATCHREDPDATASTESAGAGDSQSDSTSDSAPAGEDSSTATTGTSSNATSDGESDSDVSSGDAGTGPEVEPFDCEAIAGGSTQFYEDNVVLPELGPGPDLPASTPEAEGMDATLLAAAAAELATTPALLGFIVLRNHAVVWEAYFHGSGPDDANNIHSASKSMIATLIGIAISRGDIQGVEQPLSELLPIAFADVTDPDKLSMTVGHLLTMSGGLSWTEDETEYTVDDEGDWVQAIVDLPLQAAPGTVFNYSTGLSHLASAVLTEATGMSTCAFAHEVLMGPLGITVERWGRDPQGYFSGGFNVFMTARELAAFGLFQQQRGAWGGRQLVPSAWIDASVTPHFADYGYLWWLLEADGHALQTAWGYGGQLIYVIDDLDLVVVFTTDTSGEDPDFDGRPVLADYVIPAVL